MDKDEQQELTDNSAVQIINHGDDIVNNDCVVEKVGKMSHSGVKTLGSC
jgi:hypothetical protein